MDSKFGSVGVRCEGCGCAIGEFWAEAGEYLCDSCTRDWCEANMTPLSDGVLARALALLDVEDGGTKGEV